MISSSSLIFRYMGISNGEADVTGEGDAEGSHADMSGDSRGEEIQLKACPRCKTAIRRSLRYGNVIKQQLHDIEKVKAKLLGNRNELGEKKSRLHSRATKLSFMHANVSTEWEKVRNSILKLKSEWMAAVLENRLTLLERFCDMRKKMRKILSEVSPEICTKNNLQREFIT